MYQDLEKQCSVKKGDFDKIFSNFFSTKDITSKIQCDKSKLYDNYEIHKIHLKEPENIEKLLYHIFEHIITFSGQDFGTLAKNKSIQYEKSVGVLTKYLEILKIKSLEDLEEGINLIERKNKTSNYKIDGDLEAMNKLRELGEIILFFLTEGLLGAPVILSKVKLKTSNQMPVYGADGVHVSNDGKKLIFGESKLTNNFSNGKTAGLSSIIKFSGINPLNYISEEINILGTNFSSISIEKGKILEKIINPYYNNEKKIESLDYDLTCFLGYQDESYIDFLKNNDVGKYNKKLYEKIESLLISFKNKEKELKNKKIIFFILPITNLFELLKRYGIKIEQNENLEEIK